MRSRPRFLVVGSGGIGGIVAAGLHAAGHDVAAVTPNDAIHARVAARGFEVRGDGPTRHVRGRIERTIPAGPFDFVLLATQPPQVEEAARTALPALAERGAMVVFPNGLCEARVAQVAGDDRVLGAVIGWGATMPEPGIYERTARGGFTIGRPDGRDDPRLDDLRALSAIGPVEITRNLAGKRWSKLAINCAISTLGTIGASRLGPLMAHAIVRRLALEIMTEVAEVARAEGIRLEKVSGTLDLDWMALRGSDASARGTLGTAARHALLYAVGLKFRKMRSSMLTAIERGRAPAVDFLNGEVTSRAERHRLDAKVNARARDIVWTIARGEARAGIALVRELYASTR